MQFKAKVEIFFIPALLPHFSPVVKIQKIKAHHYAQR
jgi:hypothetical protein